MTAVSVPVMSATPLNDGGEMIGSIGRCEGAGSTAGATAAVTGERCWTCWTGRGLRGVLRTTNLNGSRPEDAAGAAAAVREASIETSASSSMERSGKGCSARITGTDADGLGSSDADETAHDDKIAAVTSHAA